MPLIPVKNSGFPIDGGPFYQAIFKNAGAGIAVFNLDKSHRILCANSHFCHIVGFVEDELKRKSFFDIIHEEDRSETNTQFQELLKDEQKTIQGQARYLLLQGGFIWAHAAYSLIRNKNGEPCQAVAVVTDISENVMAEKENQTLQKSFANISSRQQTQLGKDLFDSVNQSIAGLSFLMKKSQKQIALSDPLHEFDMDRLIYELKQVMKQVKNIARGLAPLYLSRGDFVSALRNLCTTISESGDIVFEFQNNILTPPSFDPETKNQLYSIVQEALSNATIHSEADKIRIELHYTNDVFLIRISDNGKGMAPSKKTETGTGIKMMKYRANLINANLDFDSAPAKGVTVSCRLNLGGEEYK